jgi:hypothetical protein
LDCMPLGFRLPQMRLNDSYLSGMVRGKQIKQKINGAHFSNN